MYVIELSFSNWGCRERAKTLRINKDDSKFGNVENIFIKMNTSEMCKNLKDLI